MNDKEVMAWANRPRPAHLRAEYRRGLRKRPSLRVSETNGGSWRVVIHGENNIADDGTYAEFDIARGATKEEAIEQADRWFAAMEGRNDPKLQPANLGDCTSCDNYVLSASEFPHCPTCARLVREGKPL